MGLISGSISHNSQIYLRLYLRKWGFSRLTIVNYKYIASIPSSWWKCVYAHTYLANSYLKWKRITNTRSVSGNYPRPGYNTSSISLVFDFSNESTLEWRLLTVLLKLTKKKLIQITQIHKSQKRYVILDLPWYLTGTNYPEFLSVGNFIKLNNQIWLGKQKRLKLFAVHYFLQSS